jgi:hypothetical protein
MVVVQRRDNVNGDQQAQGFDRTYEEYRRGFGDAEGRAKNCVVTGR